MRNHQHVGLLAGPHWWVLTQEDEQDPELMLPPPSPERLDLLDQVTGLAKHRRC